MSDLTTLYPHRFHAPQIHPSAFIAPSAQIIGDVVIGAESSVWFGCVLRGDVNYIRIGEKTNIQDGTIIHVSYKKTPTIIGNHVTVGHRTILHACTIHDFALIGMGAIIQDGAEIGENALIGAGSLVTQGMKILPGTKAFGVPAKSMGPLKPEELAALKESALHYVRLSASYRHTNNHA